MENLIVNQPQHKKGDGPFEDVLVEVPSAGSTPQTPCDCKWHRQPDNEQEERKNQVIEGETVPFGVLDLVCHLSKNRNTQ